MFRAVRTSKGKLSFSSSTQWHTTAHIRNSHIQNENLSSTCAVRPNVGAYHYICLHCFNFIQLEYRRWRWQRRRRWMRQNQKKKFIFSRKSEIVIKMFNCVPTIRAWTWTANTQCDRMCVIIAIQLVLRMSHAIVNGKFSIEPNHIIYSHSKLFRRLLPATTIAVAVQMLCFSFDISNSINYVNFLHIGK